MRLAPGPEFDLIRRFVAPDQLPPGDSRIIVGPGDDAAVVAAAGSGLVLSTDMSVEGVHFRRDWIGAAEIGWRATAAALSDLAAMAARPVGVLVSVALPPDDAGAFAESLMAGVRDAASHVGAALLGGDTTRSPGPLVVDVAVIGDTANPVLRSGGAPGDELWVTGWLGGAAAAVQQWLIHSTPDPEARQRFSRPVPRVAEALWLAQRGLPRAMLDLSDGIAGDVGHLAAASGVAVVLCPAHLPMHPAATASQALSGGEDFELCFAARPGTVETHQGAFGEHFGIPLTRVGWLESGEGVCQTDEQGRRSALPGGFQHFAGG